MDNQGKVSRLVPNPRAEVGLDPSLVPLRRRTDRPKDYERSMQIIGLAVITMLVVIGAGWLKAWLS